MADLHAARLRAPEVVRVVSALVDALTTRALELVAPAPGEGIVWVAVGAQARRELTPASIARGAVVCSRPPPPGWTRSVGEVLHACGFPGEVVARSTEEWSRTDGAGRARAVGAGRAPGAVGDADRSVAGARASGREAVVAALARRALAAVPPTGFDADSVLEAGGGRSDRLDIRLAAVAPIVELARWGSAAVGVFEGSTPERLLAAAGGGALSDGEARTLVDAFDLALELRIGHHMGRIAAGQPPDDEIEPAEISPLMRDHLRDVFRAVTSVQRRLRG